MMSTADNFKIPTTQSGLARHGPSFVKVDLQSCKTSNIFFATRELQATSVLLSNYTSNANKLIWAVSYYCCSSASPASSLQMRLLFFASITAALSIKGVEYMDGSSR